MNPLAQRIWFTAALMTFGWVSTVWVRSAYTIEVHPLGRSLDSFPAEIDGYKGSDIPLDEEVRKVLNADSVVNRAYVRENGDSISLHMSAWIRRETSDVAAPHVPRLCYTNAGYTILEERTTMLTTPSGKLSFCSLLLQRNGERCVASYWYQMGQSTFTTAKEARQIQRGLWGQKQWPPTVKVLLQTPAQDIDAALPRIEGFATNVLPWTNKL